MERATTRGGRTKRPLLEIPEFRKHLEHSGLTLAQWEAMQPKPDLDSESLNLARRRLTLKGKK
jgi:hypothetical protein